MTTERITCRACVGLLLFLVLPLSAMAEPNPLHAHRAAVQANVLEPVRINGWITNLVAPDRIGTSILGKTLVRNFDELDRVRVRINGKSLDARVMSRSLFRQIMDDEAARATLDVDVVCVLDGTGPNAHLEIVALGGELTEWVHARLQMRVALERDMGLALAD
jgi:hypothetical protein